MPIRLFILLTLLPSLALMPARAAEAPGTLTLREALAAALRGNPELAVYDWDIRAAEARMLQAGLRPNPTLDLTAEDVTGTREYQKGNQAERTLMLSQLVELGGKRPARVAEATAGREVAEWEYQVRRVEVLRATTLAFIDALYAQRRIALAEETLGLAERAVPLSERRVEVGKAPAVEVLRANIAVATARIAVEQGRRDQQIARAMLAAQLGQRQPAFGAIAGDLDHLEAVPGLGTLTARLFGNPQLARWSAERERRERTLRLQQAQAVPDVTASAGPRVVGYGENFSSGVIGFSMPLPLFNRNQGNIAEARVNVEKAEDERRAAETRAFASLSAAHQTMLRATAEAQALTGNILPNATSAVEQLTLSYEAGRSSQLEILDARRTLAEARAQHLRSLADFHRAQADAEALTARPVDLHRHRPLPGTSRDAAPARAKAARTRASTPAPPPVRFRHSVPPSSK